MKKLLALLAVAATAVTVSTAAASPATCVPNAVAPATSSGYAAARGFTSGCALSDSYHYALYLVDVGSGNRIAARLGTTHGNQSGATGPAFCHGRRVKSVLFISVGGIVKSSVSSSVIC